MKYFDFDIWIAAGIGYYSVHVRFSGGGEASGRVNFPFSEYVNETETVVPFPFNEDALKQQLAQIECNLYRRSDDDTRSASDRARPMQEVGQALFDTVVSKKIRDLFNNAVNSLKRERNERLRIRLIIQPPELVALPWEFLYWSDIRDFLCLNRRFSIVRYQELPVLFDPLKVELPLRIFGMISLPSDQPKLDVKQERDTIKKGMKPSRRGSVSLQWGANGTWDELRQNMFLHNWHVFHYIGHGELDETSKQGMLVAVNKNGGSTPLDATTLSEMLDNPFMRLVVLNTCEGSRSDPSSSFSSIASILAQRNIPAIVAFQYKVTNRAAIRFSQGFYGTLVKQEYVDAAVTEARLAMKEIGSMEWGSLVLHMRSRDGILFDLNTQSPDQTPSPPHLPSPNPPVEPLPPPPDPWLSAAESCYNDGNSKFTQGLYLEALDSYQQALTSYQQAIKTNEVAAKQGMRKVCMARGDAYDKLGLSKEAGQEYREAYRLKITLQG